MGEQSTGLSKRHKVARDYRGRERGSETEDLGQCRQTAGIWSFAACENLYLSSQSRHTAPRYFSLEVSYHGYGIGLGKGGKTELLRAVPDKMLALETSVNIALRTFFFSVPVVGGRWNLGLAAHQMLSDNS